MHNITFKLKISFYIRIFLDLPIFKKLIYKKEKWEMLCTTDFYLAKQILVASFFQAVSSNYKHKQQTDTPLCTGHWTNAGCVVLCHIPYTIHILICNGLMMVDLYCVHAQFTEIKAAR